VCVYVCVCGSCVQFSLSFSSSFFFFVCLRLSLSNCKKISRGVLCVCVCAVLIDMKKSRNCYHTATIAGRFHSTCSSNTTAITTTAAIVCNFNIEKLTL